MRELRLDFGVPGASPAEAFEIVCDFARYPLLCPAVRSVEILEAGCDRTVSKWEVNFRKGVLRWVEEDTYDRQRTRVAFRQLEGDIALFEGRWTCRAGEPATSVVFEARLDMGIPSLADALEPIAVRALIDNTTAILNGLFPGSALASCDEPEAAAAR